MPTIRIDEEVWRWLQSLARPFEDRPNSVLRRVAGLDRSPTSEKPAAGGDREDDAEKVSMSPERLHAERVTGERLRQSWDVAVRHALYHREGMFYENLERFPGALFDPNGYVVFETEEAYRRSPYLSIGQKLNVRCGISAIPGYVRKR